MIRHIVLFRIKPEFKAEIPALVQNFYTMKGRVEGLVDLEAGADILGSERSLRWSARSPTAPPLTRIRPTRCTSPFASGCTRCASPPSPAISTSDC